MKVGDNHRTNPLSHKPGGDEVRITFVNGKYVSPIAAKTTQPAQASVTIPKPVLPTDATKLNEAGESTAKPETNKELFERMVKNQEQTNKLLKSGNRITSDLSDEF